MKLATYIAQRRGAAADLARKLAVEHSTVMRWATGKHHPSIPMCGRIAEATDGAVTVQDFLTEAAA